MSVPNIDIPEIVIQGVPRNATERLPSTVGNSLATGGSRILDTILGLGSLWAAVEIDNRSVRNAYNQNGAGYYRAPDGSYQRIPTDVNGVPMPGYSAAGVGMGLNSNMLLIGGIVLFLLLSNRD